VQAHEAEPEGISGSLHFQAGSHGCNRPVRGIAALPGVALW